MVSAVSVFMTIVVEKLAKFAHITSGVGNSNSILHKSQDGHDVIVYIFSLVVQP